ncbi:MAG TPA: hypothetical protein VLJ39_04780 [Tepidisphaeraceae bacterium]|nr:hypothetical protein [Tepidisphaeraceae bacterium]
MTPTLEDRLLKLEISSRRWRAATLILVLAIAVGFVVAAEKPPAPAEIIQAKRFELIGPDGKPAIVLEAKPDATSLAVWGPDHQHAAVLVAQQNKTAMMLLKDKDAPEVFAEAVDQGGQIGVTDGRSGATPGDRAALNLSGSASGFALFHVVNGKPESRLSFSKFGGGLELRTPGSKAVTRVIGADKGGRVEIDDAEGNLVWSAPPAVNK